jgi:uncharacterized membrane protein YgdD (TMEM256/DUF423 family)
MRSNHFLIIATLLGMLAVILGAFGAHGLEKSLDPHMLKRFHTGVEYQFYHGVTLLVVGLLWERQQNHWLAAAGYAFSSGVLLFSGSLYVYAITDITAIAMITPFGGTAFIIGWLCLLRYALKH